MNDSALAQEWKLHQNQFDSYEKFSLLIKLTSIVITAVMVMFAEESHHTFVLTIAILAILWLQDGIWKTFQSRIEARLLLLESALLKEQEKDEQATSEIEPIQAFQFNQAFLNNRAGGIGTLLEYVKQSCRPTIAYPHVAVIAVVLLQCFCLS